MFPQRPCSLPLPTPNIYSLAPLASLLTPSLKTYPSATGLTHDPPPALTPIGAFFNRSVKKTGCLTAASSIICCRTWGVTFEAGDKAAAREIGRGGIASICVRGAGKEGDDAVGE